MGKAQKTVDGEIRILDTPQLKALEQKATEKLEQACRDAGATTLPPGWHVMARQRMAGSSRGDIDYIYIGPGGKRYRSQKEAISTMLGYDSPAPARTPKDGASRACAKASDKAGAGGAAGGSGPGAAGSSDKATRGPASAAKRRPKTPRPEDKDAPPLPKRPRRDTAGKDGLPAEFMSDAGGYGSYGNGAYYGDDDCSYSFGDMSDFGAGCSDDVTSSDSSEDDATGSSPEQPACVPTDAEGATTEATPRACRSEAQGNGQHQQPSGGQPAHQQAVCGEDGDTDGPPLMALALVPGVAGQRPAHSPPAQRVDGSRGEAPACSTPGQDRGGTGAAVAAARAEGREADAGCNGGSAVGTDPACRLVVGIPALVPHPHHPSDGQFPERGCDGGSGDAHAATEAMDVEVAGNECGIEPAQTGALGVQCKVEVEQGGEEAQAQQGAEEIGSGRQAEQEAHPMEVERDAARDGGVEGGAQQAAGDSIAAEAGHAGKQLAQAQGLATASGDGTRRSSRRAAAGVAAAIAAAAGGGTLGKVAAVVSMDNLSEKEAAQVLARGLSKCNKQQQQACKKQAIKLLGAAIPHLNAMQTMVDSMKAQGISGGAFDDFAKSLKHIKGALRLLESST